MILITKIYIIPHIVSKQYKSIIAKVPLNLFFQPKLSQISPNWSTLTAKFRLLVCITRFFTVNTFPVHILSTLFILQPKFKYVKSIKSSLPSDKRRYLLGSRDTGKIINLEQ